MEDINKEELEEVVETEETSPETQDQPQEVDENIDYKKQLEEKKAPDPEKEFKKAQRALHYNAERFKELGGDPNEVLGGDKPQPKPVVQDVPDVTSAVQKEFDRRDAAKLASSDDELNLIMWYVDNKGLSVEEAHLVANKNKILRSVSEAKRANVEFASPNASAQHTPSVTVPKRNQVEVNLLANRGMHFNPKTKTYQGKFYEEYYDRDSKQWISRKIQK